MRDFNGVFASCYLMSKHLRAHIRNEPAFPWPWTEIWKHSQIERQEEGDREKERWEERMGSWNRREESRWGMSQIAAWNPRNLRRTRPKCLHPTTLIGSTETHSTESSSFIPISPPFFVRYFIHWKRKKKTKIYSKLRIFFFNFWRKKKNPRTINWRYKILNCYSLLGLS